MVEDDEVQQALQNIERMDHIDLLTTAILSHVVNTVKDDAAITSITANTRTRDITILASCDRREEEFTIEFRRDDLLQTILTFIRVCWRYGKSDVPIVRKFQIDNPAFTPDTLVEQMRRFYPH